MREAEGLEMWKAKAKIIIELRTETPKLEKLFQQIPGTISEIFDQKTLGIVKHCVKPSISQVFGKG